ncbi:hypothetical protein CBS147323_5741 [Aspergillus niger]|nr:hypothetical protein CBS147323_5741 [Aspergillus niger]KAI3030805.1 hypothetical protein CBS147347_2478 [Aspergillus niger]KAI3077763.1 hypothetical protein CBS147353_4226 [Aspergillus niger]
MASVFTYDPDPPRVSSPWSTSGSSTPQVAATGNRTVPRARSSTNLDRADPDLLSDYGITKLDPEPQEGPTEYKLHLLLRPRRPYVSMSTSNLVGGSYHSRASLSADSPMPSSYESNPRPQQTRSTESRQQRLQHLTTQLLWRLQQSSPFHSSTTANLVLPVLPEATSQLGAAHKPARLLPGLEESQGALYEVGVADDGTFVGLTQDELEESLSTLQVMAASLGCKVDVLRRVNVGSCEWAEDPYSENMDTGKVHAECLWVAEALVSPDWDFYRVKSPGEGQTHDNSSSDNAKREDSLGSSSGTEQIRVSIAGPSAAGKSSLLGTLTSSVLDNGRGTSRLGLLKHRHEISSGITSSVAHELIGYAADESQAQTAEVINYACGNIAAWDDIHAASEGGRLAFVSDLPGSVRYLKSTLRGMIGWAPHYVLLCIPATCDDEAPAESGQSAEQPADMTLALSHLELCAKMEIPTVVVITKMDVASRSGLRNNLAKVLSALKSSGKKPAMMSVPTAQTVDLQRTGSKDVEEVRKLISTTESWESTVPIVLTSAVDGSGIGKLHALLRYLPIPARPPSRDVLLPKTLATHTHPEDVFDVDEVFAIPPSKVYSVAAEQEKKEAHGVVLCGLVRYGSISAGDELLVGPLMSNTSDPGNCLQRQRSRSGKRPDSIQHSSTNRSRPASGDFSTSFIHGSFPGKPSLPTQAYWQRVRAVSVRNLRLPIQKLTQDQVGTIGIEPISLTANGQMPRLGKIRKGSILLRLSASSASIPRALLFHTGFVASFPSSEFASPLSPPVLLGGNATVYVANVRTTVKLSCMALAEDEVISRPPSPTEPEFFNFDGDTSGYERGREPGVQDMVQSSSNPGQGDIKITFEFVSSVEWIEVGSRVLLMPGTSTALVSAQGSSQTSGLEGFLAGMDSYHTLSASSNMAGPSSLFLGSRVSSDVENLTDDDDEFMSSASTTSHGSEERTENRSEPEMKTEDTSVEIPMTPPRNSIQKDVDSGPCQSSHLKSDATPLSTVKQPLRLLDMPIDVLQVIIKEVTHTNDLTSLALTCSALHSLAIPQMYSRFDIVWPETLSSSDHPAGVDALSYGLATLVMGQDIFRELPPRRAQPCPHCGCESPAPDRDNPTDTLLKIRRGNYYAQYTRKFSVGNGPLVWVQEYSVTKETGKMLGTLVALAVARMVNLETFVWDMPTGVLRDVWIALSSLANRPGHECRLQRVWVRWHDNSENTMRPLAGPSTASSVTLPDTQAALAGSASNSSLLQRYGHVEYPSLSILPPLKSLSVLDIDEPSYLEEMAVLVERSRDRLKELRIGVSSKVYQASWLKPAGSWQAEQPTPSRGHSGWPKSGGVLGVVLGRSEEPTRPNRTQADSSPKQEAAEGHAENSHSGFQAHSSMNSAPGSPLPADDITSIALSMQGTHIAQQQAAIASETSLSREIPHSCSEKPLAVPGSGHQMLKLETLELERVPLSIPVALHALDWRQLTTLTIFRCEGHEKLWRALRRQFSPSVSSRSKHSRREGDQSASEYRLNLRHIHTDAVSPYLLLFIKDTLAPNTLQTLFLHEAPMYDSIVHIDAIYKNAIKTHYLSLQKILVDSTQRAPGGSEMPSVRWYKWMFTRQMLTFLSSGRMPRLRELSIALHSKDWHYFLQRLPYMPQLRALHIPHIARQVHRDPKELAMMILDIVTIRPEVGINYVGIQNKCYEILEAKDGDAGEFYDTDDSHSEGFVPGGEEWAGSETNEDESDDDGGVSAMDSHSDLSSDDRTSSDGEESEMDYNKTRVSFRLREILFYDDKIAIFKARHGVL